VDPKVCSATSGSGQCLWNEKVDVHLFKAGPSSGLVTRLEARRPERVLQQRRITEILRGDREVSVCRVLRESKIGVTGVDVDRLSTDEDESVQMRFQG
jgi:hypothetical protein